MKPTKPRFNGRERRFLETFCFQVIENTHLIRFGQPETALLVSALNAQLMAKAKRLLERSAP